MPTEPFNAADLARRRPPIPPIIEGIMAFFYAAVWWNVLVLVSFASEQAANGDNCLLLPVGLYIALLIGFFLINLYYYRRQGGGLINLFWGFEKQKEIQVAFIGLTFILVVWIVALDPTLAWLYYMLVPQTIGLFAGRWRWAVPLVVLELVILAYQTDFVPQLIALRNLDSPFGWTLAAVIFSGAYVFLVTGLVRSRIHSEILVRDLQETKR